MSVTSFVFNDFQENTFLINDPETNMCVVVDPGCYTSEEQMNLYHEIKRLDLELVYILNTHCHLDHVFGNAFLKERFPEAKLAIHQQELPVLRSYPTISGMYGISCEPSPMPDLFLEHAQVLSFGTIQFEVFLTPGHSPASISFYNRKEAYILGGDVLFHLSIGRTDLPGGNFSMLMSSIRESFLSLPDSTVVYCGHGQATTIGFERKNNPFLN